MTLYPGRGGEGALLVRVSRLFPGVPVICLCPQDGDVSFPQECRIQVPLRGPCNSTLYTWNGKGGPWPMGSPLGVGGSLSVSGCLLCPRHEGACLSWMVEGVGVLACPLGCPHILQVLGGFPAVLPAPRGPS